MLKFVLIFNAGSCIIAFFATVPKLALLFSISETTSYYITKKYGRLDQQQNNTKEHKNQNTLMSLCIMFIL